VAKFAATDFDITIGGTDFSDSLAAVTLDISREQLEITAFGDSARRYIGGLQDSSVTLSFHQDFASGSVDETVFSNLGGTVAIVVKPTSGAVSSYKSQLLASTRLLFRAPHSAVMWETWQHTWM
jgi:hypothetical protein